MENEDPSVPQIQVKFITKQEKYAVPDTHFSVPITVGQSELNNLINSLRSENDPENITEVDFDFLVHGEFLHQNINDFLNERSISVEAVLEIEYVEKSIPPEPEDSLMHDDWVSAVHGSSNLIISGCYDSTLHLWTAKGEHKLTIPGHAEPVKDVCWISHSGDVSTFASSSMDQSALLWKYNHPSNTIECIAVLQGHTKSVDCVAGEPTGGLIATGSWDSTIHLWNPAKPEGKQIQQVKKKRKTIGKAPVLTPSSTLSEHKQGVSDLAWISSSELVSASWDHTIKVWDVEQGGLKSQLAGSKAFFSISFSPLNGSLLAASADHYIRRYDPRSTEGSVIKSMYKSHKGWVTDVCWSASREHEFVSCGQDMLVKQWDARGTKAPLYDLEGHMDKVLSCDWSAPQWIVSGGADNAVKVFSVQK